MSSTRVLLVTVTLLLGLLQRQVFSASFVYEDVLAYPRYQVVLTESKIPESQLFRSKETEDEVLQNQQDSVKESVLMKTISGQPFLCNIPNVDEVAERQRRTVTEELSESETKQSIERALKLLEPLAKDCLYFRTHGYWTYEYCHMSHVRQFHIDGTAIQGDKPVPLRQVGADQAFYLGYFNPKQKASGKSGKQQTDVTEHRDNSVSKTTMRHIGDQRYLTQYWEGGTVCDLTGKPRSIEIQFHCDRQMHDRISMFQEVATCQYQMAISTPRLCGEMLLTSQKESTANKIQCHPVVADHLISAQEEPGDDVEKEQAEQDMFVDAVTDQDDIFEDQLDAEQDKQQALLATIAELTTQIQDMQRQLKYPDLLQNNNEQDEIIEIAFLHVDENGQVVSDESLPMSEIMRKMASRNTESSKEQNEIPDENQQKNKKAYDRQYLS